jgi:hypothetical protein
MVRTFMLRLKPWLQRRVDTYSLFWTYLAGVKKAGWEILWGDGLLFVGFVLYSLRYTVSWSVIGTFVGIAWLIASYHIWRVDHLRLMPMLVLRDPAVLIHDAHTFERIERRYVQLLPSCVGDSPVEGVEAHLLRVMRWDHAQEEWVSTELDHTLPLVWSYGGPGPQTVQHGLDRRVNILWFEDRAHLALETPFRIADAEHVLLNPGEPFRFDIRLTARDTTVFLDVSVKIGFTVERDGAWYEELTAEKL